MGSINISSAELMNENCPKLPAKAADFSKHSFWYYTSLHTADLILKNKCIYISNLSLMNDIDEATLHNCDKEYVHCFCLCNSDTEKIPMWYLYAGITGKGVSLGFSPSTMLAFINSIKTVTTPDQTVVLTKDVDFDLDYGWVFYRKKETPSQVMFKRKWYSLRDPEMFEDNNFFIKSYPWEYEKEFRIVIRNKTNQKYDRLVLNISDVYKNIKIKLAPELSNEQFTNLITSLHGFCNYLIQTPQKSKLSINMNLCKRNFSGFLDYIKESNNNDDIEYSKICEAISPYCKKQRRA